MSRALSTRLTRLEARRRGRTLRGLVIAYDPDATEEEIDALVEERLRGLPDSPTRRIVLYPKQYETPEAWEAAGGDE